MKAALAWIPLLSLFLFACDVSQFDPSAHRARFEKERLNSNVKRMELTDEGRLPVADVPASEGAPSQNQ